MGNKDSIVRGHTENLHASRPRAEAVILNWLGSDTHADLGEHPREEEACGTHPGDTDPDDSHFLELILP